MVDSNFVSNKTVIEVIPSTSMADERVQIRLRGFKPNSALTIRAETRDDSNVRWESNVTVHTDLNGCADLSTCKPIRGTYSEPDSMGLFWSMKPDPRIEKPQLFSKNGVNPTKILLTVECNGVNTATATCLRLFVSADTEVREIKERGLAGKFFTPKKPGRYPGIIVLEGSAGGLFWSEQIAALLSRYGYAALALAYFRYEGLPPNLVNIPLEYFETAMEWMWEQGSVITGKVAVSGISRGGELVLLLGSTFPKIRCVVAYVPSNAVCGPFSNEPVDKQSSSWTFKGKGIPYIKKKEKPEKVDEVYSREPIALTPWFLANYDFGAVEDVAEGAIPVENMNGAVLMITGRDDRMWPSSMMAEYAIERMHRKGFKHVHQHLSYDGAGHIIQYPYLPSMVNQLIHPANGSLYMVGGGNVNHHLAEVDSWNKVLEFLEVNYRQI